MIPFLLGPIGMAWSFIRNSWLGRAAAIAFGVLVAVFMIYRKGASDQSHKQREANLEEYIDARKRADKAAEAARSVGSLSDDDLNERLRKRPGAFRD